MKRRCWFPNWRGSFCLNRVIFAVCGTSPTRWWTTTIVPASGPRNIFIRGLIPWPNWPRICPYHGGLTRNRTTARGTSRPGGVVPAWAADRGELASVSACDSAGEFCDCCARFQRSSLCGFGWAGIVGQRLYFPPQIWTPDGFERGESSRDEAAGDHAH